MPFTATWWRWLWRQRTLTNTSRTETTVSENLRFQEVVHNIEQVAGVARRQRPGEGQQGQLAPCGQRSISQSEAAGRPQPTHFQ